MNLIETGHHQVNGYRNPNLSSDGVITGTVKGLDSEVLLYPFEEEFDLPSALVDRCDDQCRKVEVIGQENKPFLCFWVDEADSPESFRVVTLPFIRTEFYNLITSEAGRSVYVSGFSHSKTSVRFTAYDEEGLGRVDLEKAPEVEIPAVEYVYASSFECHLLKEVDVMNRSFCNAYKNWDRAGQVNLGVQLNCCFCFSEGGPREQRQAKVDSRCIHGINHFVQAQGIRVINIETSSLANEGLSDFLINSPVPKFVGVGQIGSCDVSTNPHGVKIPAGSQATFDTTQTVAIGYLGKCHCQELVTCTHAPTAPRHRVAGNTAIELFPVKHIHYLGENQSAFVHPASLNKGGIQANSNQMRHTLGTA